MEKWRGHVAVVTGASAGIGEALFKDLANAGITVAGFARRKEKVEVSTSISDNLILKLLNQLL
jgi:NADP-dependent 3-hydroxy acid dehydrogenase YdfG